MDQFHFNLKLKSAELWYFYDFYLFHTQLKTLILKKKSLDHDSFYIMLFTITDVLFFRGILLNTILHLQLMKKKIIWVH